MSNDKPTLEPQDNAINHVLDADGEFCLYCEQAENLIDTDAPCIARQARGVTDDTDAPEDILDRALDAAEDMLKDALPSVQPVSLAAQFIGHAGTHLSIELSNIKAHGHRNDDPESVPPVAPILNAAIPAALDALNAITTDVFNEHMDSLWKAGCKIQEHLECDDCKNIATARAVLVAAGRNVDHLTAR